jgi:hypothetical protein
MMNHELAHLSDLPLASDPHFDTPVRPTSYQITSTTQPKRRASSCVPLDRNPDLLLPTCPCPSSSFANDPRKGVCVGERGRGECIERLSERSGEGVVDLWACSYRVSRCKADE